MGFSVKDPIRGDILGNAATASKAIGDKNGADITTTYYKATNPSGYTSNTGTITGVSVNSTSVATSGVANITSIPASILTGAIPSAVTATTQSQGNNSTKIATTAYVDTAITNLPEPMIFKGSLGTGGTITSLPTAAASNEGHTYKVITAGTYASQAAKVGDTFISDGSTWVLIPSGDEPSGTVTSITIKGSSPITVDSESAITTSGTRTISHANSGVTAGTYKSVTVNATGHVTGGSNPTTLSGYGITDALSKSGGAITGAITRDLGSGAIADTNLFTVTGSTDGFKVNYNSTTADVGVTTLSTTDDANAKISIGNTVSSTYKEAISVTNGSAVVNGYTVAEAAGKAVVTSIDTSASLPTSNAVKTFVEGKGYVTTDTKNTAGSTDTSSKIFLIGATSQAANPQTYSDDQVYVTSGTLQANVLNSTTRINANTALSGTAGGLALYGTNADPSQYGITMRQTGTTSGNLGKHGYVQGDWAGYFCFDGATNRGWVFRQAGNNVASIGGTGNAVFNGSVTIGGNTTNASGARMEYNSTNKCIEFNFV